MTQRSIPATSRGRLCVVTASTSPRLAAITVPTTVMSNVVLTKTSSSCGKTSAAVSQSQKVVKDGVVDHSCRPSRAAITVQALKTRQPIVVRRLAPS